MRKRLYRLALPLLLPALLAVSGCGNSRPDTMPAATAPNLGAPAAPAAQLPLPVVPDSLSAPDARAAYVLTHFWDSLDFCDSRLTLDSIFMEQNFANFVSLFPIVTDDVVRASADTLIARAAVNEPAYAMLLMIVEKYLYDPNSPMRSEPAFILFAERALAHGISDEALCQRVNSLRLLALKNRVGSIAADFHFLSPDGTDSSLHDFCAGSDLTLLIFFDPDCDTCRSARERLQADYTLAQLMAAGSIRP